MSDTPPPQTDGPIPEAEVQPARRSFLERLSVVWLVPLGALLLALALAWQAYSDRGPLIEITFDNGSGIAAGETELRFRDIGVGRVERVGFTADLEKVLVEVRLEEEVVPYVDESAQFWVVRPEVTAEGITGLNTVLSGVYIEGSWDAEPGGLVTRFAGQSEVPVARPDQAGTRIVLRAETGRGLTPGAPILYRGLEVGRLGAPRIATDGITVLAEAFIDAPHDRVVTDRTRFWATSGFSFDLGPQGASLNFASLASLVRGGLSFDTLVSGGEPVPDGAAFDIYSDREAAVASLFAADDPDAPRLNVTAIFEDNVAGLAIGAPVTLRGLEIGEVADLSGQVDPERFGDDRVRLIATLSIRLDELAMGAEQGDQQEVLDFLETRVREGLRARLANAALLTGGLKVEIVEVADAAPAELDRDAEPFPVLPTAPAEVQDVAGAAQGLIARVNALPVEEVLQNAIAFLENATELVRSEEIQQVPGEVAGLVSDMRNVVSSEAVQALPEQLGGIAEDLRGALAELEAREGVARLVEAVEAAGRAAEEVGSAVEGVPALVERIEAVAAKAEGLALEELVDQAGGLVADARGLVGTEAAQALPGQLNETLAGLDGAVTEAEALLADLRAQDITGRLTAAVEETSAAAADVGAAVEGVPELVEELNAVAAKANALSLETLVDQAGGLVTDARAIFGTEAAQALPAQVNETLAGLDGAVTEAEAILADLRAQDITGRLTAAVEETSAAAADVGAAVEGVPELVEELNAVAAKANSLALEDLVQQAGGLVSEARTIVAAPDTQALPGRLGETLDALSAAVTDARGVIGTLEEEESVARLTDALEAAAQAATDVSASVEGVPALVERLEGVAARAETLEVEALVDEATGLAAAAREVLGTEDARALPGRLGGALTELEAALSELRAGGTVENVNAALASARRAADSVAATSEDLPALVDRTAAVLTEAQAVLGQLGEAGALNREARSALREVGRAAEAVRSLARLLERRPNSILTGR